MERASEKCALGASAGDLISIEAREDTVREKCASRPLCSGTSSVRDKANVRNGWKAAASDIYCDGLSPSASRARSPQEMADLDLSC